MGFERLESNAMVSIGAWLLIPINLLWGFTAYALLRQGYHHQNKTE